MAGGQVEALRAGYEALNVRDLDKVLELMDPELEWSEAELSPEAGTHRGRDGFERFLRSWLESFDDFRVEPEEIVEHGDRLIAVIRQTGRGAASGIAVDVRVVHVWTIRDGTAVQWQSFPDREAAMSELGLG
jgi:uncharacterized protein